MSTLLSIVRKTMGLCMAHVLISTSIAALELPDASLLGTEYKEDSKGIDRWKDGRADRIHADLHSTGHHVENKVVVDLRYEYKYGIITIEDAIRTVSKDRKRLGVYWIVAKDYQFEFYESEQERHVCGVRVNKGRVEIIVVLRTYFSLNWVDASEAKVVSPPPPASK